MLLELKNISHYYTYNNIFKTTKKQILKNINFTIDSSQNIALIGPSGCGKSTLAKIIVQLQTPKSGEIFLNNKKIQLKTLTQKREFYKQVQILFQDPISSLNPKINILQNLQEPLINLLSIKDKQEQLKKIIPIFTSLNLQKQILYYYPSMLSGGQAQRVCISRMLLIQPKLIILDETTSGLDYILQDKVMNLFLSLQKEHSSSFLFITHDISLAKKFCQNIMLMQNGEIIEIISNNQKFKSLLGQELLNSYESIL